jgi:hypothetical protein
LTADGEDNAADVVVPLGWRVGSWWLSISPRSCRGVGEAGRKTWVGGAARACGNQHGASVWPPEASRVEGRRGLLLVQTMKSEKRVGESGGDAGEKEASARVCREKRGG